MKMATGYGEKRERLFTSLKGHEHNPQLNEAAFFDDDTGVFIAKQVNR